MNVAQFLGGQFTSPSQVVYLPAGQDVDVQFSFLRPDTLYGRLCIVEEAVTPSTYTSMGRLIGSIPTEKCYFDALKTRPAHIEDSSYNDIRAYRHTMNAAVAPAGVSVILVVSLSALMFSVRR